MTVKKGHIYIGDVNMGNRILVVDDEKLIVKGIKFSLEQDGMEVDCAYDGEEAVNLAKQVEYDIVLLDVMLPVYDGFEVLSRIREFSSMPVIMLTAKGDDMDKILGLEYGADDYITKPFNILEVKARIKAIMRRSKKEASNSRPNKMIVKGDLKLDVEGRNVKIGDTVLFPKTDGIDIKFNDCKDEVLDFNTGFILLYSKSILGKISKWWKITNSLL